MSRVLLPINDDDAPIEIVTDVFETKGFIKGPVLGTGQFGYVVDCRKPDDPIMSNRAVKVFPGNLLCREVRNLFLNEVMILNRVNHSYSVMMFFPVACSNYFAICMEPLPGGSLESRLHNIELCDAEKYLCQVSSALGYLHNTMNMAHCNISLSSIFLDQDGNAILCNFQSTIQFDSPGQSTSLVKRCAGSPAYHPPEVRLNSEDEDFEVDLFKVDVHALGVVLWGVTFKSIPNNELYTYLDDVKNAKDKIPDSFRKWLKLLLDPLPKQRVTMDDFIFLLKQESCHGYLTDDDDEKTEET